MSLWERNAAARPEQRHPFEWATVTAVDTTAGTVTATVSTATEPYVAVMLGSEAPAVGERIALQRVAGGTDYVYGGAPGTVASGGGGHPDLAAHDTLGLATQSELDAHVTDAADAHDASAVSFVPTGGIAATDVQAAIAELDTEKSGTAHTHSYDPVRLWIPATAFALAAGTPALGLSSVGTWQVWLFDGAGAQEEISTAVNVPPGWANASVTVWWINHGVAGAGNVRWLVAPVSIQDNDTLSAGTTTFAVAAALALNVVETTTVIASTAVDPAKALLLRVIRNSGHSTDTLTNDVGLLGVMLARV